MRKRLISLGLVVVCLIASQITVFSQEKLQEVNKNEIPPQYLEKTLKVLPPGIKIWDESEALSMLDNPDAKVLWVDTRPRSMYDGGTVKDGVLLAYNKNEQPDDAIKTEPALLTKDSLQAALTKSGATTAAIFCQGPQCHRSYNAVLRAVNDWGFDMNTIVWFRAGYPNLLKKVQEDPALARKMNKYFKGAILGQ